MVWEEMMFEETVDDRRTEEQTYTCIIHYSLPWALCAQVR